MTVQRVGQKLSFKDSSTGGATVPTGLLGANDDDDDNDGDLGRLLGDPWSSTRQLRYD